MISVTAVDVSPDLKFAKVYVSVLDKGGSEQVLKGLKSAAGYLRRELGRALNLRSTPELDFLQDDSMAKGGSYFGDAAESGGGQAGQSGQRTHHLR